MTATYRSFLKWPLALIMLAFTSCSKFLDERPSKTTALEATTTTQLDALLNSYSSFYSEGNRTVIFGTDDNGFSSDLYNARPGTFTMAAVEFSLWDIQYLPEDTRENFWSGEYKKIFTANMVLGYADKVTGTPEEKAILKADAHFIRAYSYWVLANTYCLPYTAANKGEMGLPIKTSVSFDQPLARQPLEAVYNLIESDLKEALNISLPLVQNGKARHWRANKAGVNGFAARYYLHRNNYTEALKYANAALSEYSQLVDYNTEMKYGRDVSVVINPGTPASKNVVLKFPYTHDNQSDFTDMLGWKEFLYFRMLYHESWWYIPSKQLLDLYDKDHDLRYKYHMVQGYSYDRGITSPAYDYPGYVFFFKDRLPSGPTTAEMLLIKAECLARTGNVPDALAAVNTLRAKRLTPGTWVNLAATTKEEAVKTILEERRRELPFTQRWFDIRRFNNNDDPNDDVVLSKTFYPYTIANVTATEPLKTYTLPKDSRRFAAPIPKTEMITSNNEIQQNTY